MAKIDTLLLTKMAKRTILFGPHKRVILFGPHKRVILEREEGWGVGALRMRDRDDRRTPGRDQKLAFC